MDTNRPVVLLAVVVVVVVAFVALVPPLIRRDRDPVAPSAVAGPGAEGGAPDRARPPLLDGRVLAPVAPGNVPAEPVQWAAGAGPVPSNTWWSSAVAGPGAPGLWPQPLAVAVTPDGVVQVADPEAAATPAGGVEAPFVPALFLDLGAPAATSVVAHGPLHVTVRVATADASVDLTLVQGSPVVELAVVGEVSIRVPGLDLDGDGDPDTVGLAPSEAATLSFGTSEGRWALGSADSARFDVAGDRVVVRAGAAGHLALGPVPDGGAAGYEDRLQAIAAHPVRSSSEELSVDDTGATSQVLAVDREGGAEGRAVSLWALQPHHRRYAAEQVAPLGTLASALGPVPVVAGPELRLIYPAVPILWSSVAVPGGDPPSEVDQALVDEGTGSYFGGKTAYAAAARSDLLRAVGDEARADRDLDRARLLLDAIANPVAPPSLRWDDRWGSVVVEPAEFGAGTELNDHQLQYGYWVAAASHVVEADPTALDRYREMVDLLVADYAGAATVPGSSSSLPATRTWSPYEGHSWASGTAPFGAGNNLESISESTFSWWAAARWFLATGRPDVAETFVARFTVESALTGISWLPDGDRLPVDADSRPWSGVVWGGKVDPDTWFDPADESALGIRLLPLGPASLGRYGSEATVAAARARWDWCDDQAAGCTGRWSNLLDSDAAVAGRARRAGPDPEPSTSATVAAWWRDLWERTDRADGWTCSVGVVARRTADGDVVVLASSPGAETELRCLDADGSERWSGRVSGTRAAVVPGR